MQTLPREFFEEEARKKLIKGNIFTYANPVITIKTGGRTYGGLSRHVDGLGVKLPDLTLGTAVFQNPYIFVALWDDESSYSPQHLAACASAVMRVAFQNNVELIAMPPLGGKHGVANLWIVEMALFEAGDVYDHVGMPVPEHVYVRL